MNPLTLFSDLGDVPQALRVILEKALSEDASQENLDRYLPSIRDIIVTLLRQLKQKQMLIRSQAHAAATTPVAAAPPASFASNPNSHPILQRSLTASQAAAAAAGAPPLNTVPGITGQPSESTNPAPSPPGSSAPLNKYQPYDASTPQSQYSSRSKQSPPNQQGPSRYNSRSDLSVTSPPNPPPRSTQHSPVHSQTNLAQEQEPYIPPPSPSQASSHPSYAHHVRNKSSLTGGRVDLDPAAYSRKDPLAALQRGEALERRASRRFSAYQFAKLTNGSSSRSDIPDLPTFPGGGSAVNSPNPNFSPNPNGLGTGMGISGSHRGYPHASPNIGAGGFPQGQQSHAAPQGSQFLPTKTPRSTQLAEYTSSTMLVSDGNAIPHVVAPGALGAPVPPPGSSLAAAKAAISGGAPVGAPFPQQQPQRQPMQPGVVTATRSVSAPTGRPVSLIHLQHQYAQNQQEHQEIQQQQQQLHQQPQQPPQKPQSQDAQSESSTPENSAGSNSNEIVLFLQIGRSVKKCTVHRSDLTIPSLRLLFVDKFAYPMSASEAIPDIYIQDPKSGIRYELDEDVLSNDVYPGSLLSLNVEAVDEVKKHIDEGFATLTKHIADISNKVTAHGTSIQKINEIQESLAQQQELKAVNTITPVSSPSYVPPKGKTIISKPKLLSKSVRTNSIPTTDGLRRMDDLRRDVVSVKRASNEAISEMRDTITTLISKAQVLQSVDALPPPGDSSRSFMERSFKKLTNDSDKLLTDVDDLQDVIEDLRKDVAQRGVRPEQRRLENVSKDVATAKDSLAGINKYIQAEKAGWKKIWERELDKICEEQQILKFHEDILQDLTDDLGKAEETFNLVEQCSTEATKNSSFRQVVLPPPIEGQSVVHAKDAVLSEVVALQPNHQKRLEAIERAEKLRRRDLESRGIGIGGDFMIRELSDIPEELKPQKEEGTKKKKKKTDEEKKKKKKTKKKAEKKKEEEEEEDASSGVTSADLIKAPFQEVPEPPSTPPPQGIVHASSLAPPLLDTKIPLAPPVVSSPVGSISAGTVDPVSSPARQKVRSLLIDSAEDLGDDPNTTIYADASSPSSGGQLLSPSSDKSIGAAVEGLDHTNGNGVHSEISSFHSATSSPRESIIMPLSTSPPSALHLEAAASKQQPLMSAILDGQLDSTSSAAETITPTTSLQAEGDSSVIPLGNGQNPFAY